MGVQISTVDWYCLLPSLASYSLSLLTLSWTDTIAYNVEFMHLTEEDIGADVVEACAMEEGSGDELDKPQESTIKKKLLSSARGWH